MSVEVTISGNPLNVEFGGGDSSISGLNGIIRLSSSEYTALATKDSETLYVVQYSDHIKLFLGTLPCYDPSAVHSSDVDTIAVVEELPVSPDSDTVYIIQEAT